MWQPAEGGEAISAAEAGYGSLDPGGTDAGVTPIRVAEEGAMHVDGGAPRSPRTKSRRGDLEPKRSTCDAAEEIERSRGDVGRADPEQVASPATGEER